MSVRTVAILCVAALLALPMATGATGTEFHRRVERLVASPGPVGPHDALSDQATWRVVVPPGGRVEVRADAASDATPFHLRFEPWGARWSPSPIPSAHQSVELPPGDWRVVVDPAAGVQVDVRVSFRGPVAFSLVDVAVDRPCGPAGACLP